MKDKRSKRTRKQAVGFLIVILFSLCATPANGSNPNDKLCFTKTVWFGSVAGPQIDGVVDGDPGWRGAFRYVFGNGSSSPDVIVQGIRDDTSSPPVLYLSIQSNNLDGLTTGVLSNDPYLRTIVVFGFDPDGNPAHMQLIHVYPVTFQSNNSVASSYQGNVQKINYWPNGQSTWTQPPTQLTAASPGWLFGANSQVSYRQTGSSYQWSLEMKLPITGNANTGLNTLTSPFGLYISVLQVFNGSTGYTYHQRSWPPEAPENCPDPFTCTSPQAGTPNPVTQWGASPLVNDPSGVCGGVSVGSQNNDIFTSNSPNSAICLVSGTTTSNGTICPAQPNVNVFTAKVHNTMVDGTGAPQTAHNVQASFFISPWGITNDWGPIPQLNNPPVQDVPPASPPAGTLFSTPSWFPVPSGFNANDHKCIMVKLDSAGSTGTGSNTVFLNNTAVQNMDFVGASKFVRVAEIGAKGYPPHPKRPDGTVETDQLFDLRVITHEEVLKPGHATPRYSQTTAPGAPKRKRTEGHVTSELTWILEACRHTGHYIITDGEKFELCDDIGAFGYIVRHVGDAPVRKWKVRFTGDGLGQPVGNVYSMHVPQDRVQHVTTTIEAQEMNLAVFLDAGGNIPHGTFGNGFDPGFSLNAGLEYMINSHFSAEGIFGYHHFPAKIGSSLNVYQFSANGKAYLATGMIRPFVNGGIGGYTFSPGSTNFGGNVGGGVLFELTSRLGLQGSYNLHVVNTAGTATKFSAVQGGTRFVF